MFLEQQKQQQEIGHIEPVDLPKKHGYHLPLVIPWLIQLNLESFG